MYNLKTTNDKKHDYYKQFPRDGECVFCKSKKDELVVETKHFVILRNLFGYDIFDMCEVEDHLMLIPKKHSDNLDVLTKEERLEFMNIAIQYEKKGYNIFFREPHSIIKTVDHHHTHLLKLGKRVKLIEYTKEPYSMTYMVE